MLAKTRAALAAAFFVPLLGGCGLDNINDGQVRLLNATTEYSAINLNDVDSSNNTNALISGTASYTVSDYAKLAAGTYTFQIAGAGASSSAASTSGSVTKGNHFALFTYLTSGTLNTQFVSEDETAPSSGNAKLRIFNAASGEVGGVDVYVTSSACTALGTTDTPLATNVTALQSSFTQIVATSSGTAWNLCVTATGNQQQVLMAAAQTFKDQEISTLILAHTAGGVLLNGMLLDQQGSLTTYATTLARVRVVADAASGAAVSATVGSTTLATALTSPTIGGYTTVTAGSLATTMSIGGVALASQTYNIAAGNDYTLLVAGTAAAATPVLFTDSNTPSTVSALPVKMRLINGINGWSDAAQMLVNSSIVAQGITFDEASTYSNVASASTGTAEVDASSGGIPMASLTSQTLDSGAVYTLFLLGDYTASSSPPVSATLLQDKAPTSVSTSASSASS